MKRYLVYLRQLDWVLLGSVVILMGFGLAALYSIAISSEQPDFSNVNRQIVIAVIGLAVVLALSFIDYHYWMYLSGGLYGLAVLLLIAVLFVGRTISGTTGWFSLFGFNFQPVEIAKLALILFLATFLSRRLTTIHETKNFLISAGLMGLLFALVMRQPDFGSGIILVAIWFVLLFLARANKRHLLAVIGLGVVAILIAWLFLFQTYQRDRILTFFDPQADPYGRGYQVRQAVIAVGAGGLFGRGLGFGSQSQLKFIPASQTDFIFAVISEELGFLGVGLVIVFWGVIFYRLLRAVQTSRDSFATFYLLGISVVFFIHVFINIGMNIGIVPVTGISLPFVSYGGSFLLSSLISIGIAQSMIVRNRL